MDATGNLLQTIAAGIAGLIEGAFRALGGAFQGVFHAFQAILPGPWLPIVVFVVVIVVFWQFIKR